MKSAYRKFNASGMVTSCLIAMLLCVSVLAHRSFAVEDCDYMNQDMEVCGEFWSWANTPIQDCTNVKTGLTNSVGGLGGTQAAMLYKLSNCAIKHGVTTPLFWSVYYDTTEGLNGDCYGLWAAQVVNDWYQLSDAEDDMEDGDWSCAHDHIDEMAPYISAHNNAVAWYNSYAVSIETALSAFDYSAEITESKLLKSNCDCGW